MTENELHPDVEKRINEHLEAIDKTLSAKGVPLPERRSITDDVETQIRDMLASSSSTTPTISDLDVVFQSLDAPESYVEECSAREIGDGSTSACTKTPRGNNTGGLHVMGGFITLVLTVFAGWWFWHHYYRIGPEYLEPLVLIAGAAAILLAGGFGLIVLVRGIKLLSVGHFPSPSGEAQNGQRRTVEGSGLGGMFNAKFIFRLCLFVIAIILIAAGSIYCVWGKMLPLGILLLGIGALLLTTSVMPTLARLSLTAAAVIALLTTIYGVVQYRMYLAERRNEAQVNAKAAMVREEVLAREHERQLRVEREREKEKVPHEQISLYPEQMALLTAWMKERGFEEKRISPPLRRMPPPMREEDFKWFVKKYEPQSAEIRYEIILTASGELKTDISFTISRRDIAASQKERVSEEAKHLTEELKAYYESIRSAQL